MTEIGIHDDVIRISEPGWRFAVIGFSLMFAISASFLLATSQEDFYKTLLISALFGLFGFLATVPTWIYLSFVRTVEIHKKSEKVVVKNKIHRLILSRKEFPLSDCELRRMTIFSQRISCRNGKQALELYLDRDGMIILSKILSEYRQGRYADRL